MGEGGRGGGGLVILKYPNFGTSVRQGQIGLKELVALTINML